MQSQNTMRLFVEDHNRLLSLFDDFKDSKRKDPEKSADIFSQLAQALHKHFREEEILYLIHKHKTGSTLPIIQTIGREHSILLAKLNEIRQSMRESGKIDVSGFRMLLERHKNIEERTLYPELENALTEKEKEDAYLKLKAA